MKETWFDDGLKIWGALCLAIPVILWIVNRGKKKADVDISKTEREANKFQAEKYLVELNVSDLIDKKAAAIEEKYKDIIFNMQKEHFEIKKDYQGKMEKEMRARIEAEQENEILKNELQLIREKSDDQDRLLDQLRKEVDNLKKKKQ